MSERYTWLTHGVESSMSLIAAD